MSKTSRNNISFTTVVQKIAWEYIEEHLRHWFCLKQLILSILSILPILKFLKTQNLLQTNVNMCKIGHNNLTFTTIEQNITWEYIEAYQR